MLKYEEFLSILFLLVFCMTPLDMIKYILPKKSTGSGTRDYGCKNGRM